jgi:DinB family
MIYYGSKELADSFRTVRKNSIVIAEEIPEQHYDFRIVPETRTVAQLLVHLAVIPRMPEQIHFIEKRTSFDGFDFFAHMGKLIAEEQVVRSKTEIIGMLHAGGDKFAHLLEGASEDFLSQRVEYPKGMTPPNKSRFEMLLSAKEHEMHHRGQLMLIERQLGIVPHLTREMQARIASVQASKSSA